MNQAQQRIAIAEACGWKHHPDTLKWNWLRPDGRAFNGELPDYLSDLNAMHEAEKELVSSWQWNTYTSKLAAVCGWNSGIHDARTMANVIHSTPAQRAEAFLRTLNLWTES